jgi:uncharacterized membrane protein YbhN (UPF0104 family)
MSAFRPPAGDDAPRMPGGRRAAFVIVAAILVALGVVLLIAKAAGFAAVERAVSRADSRWFVVCFGAEVVSWAAYAVVVRETIRWQGGPDPGYGLGVHVTLASLGATRIVAAGGAGGIAVTYWCFRRARFSVREAFVRVLGLNTLVFFVFGIGAWTAALLATLGLFGSAPLALTVPWLVVVPACVVAGRFVTEAGRVERLSDPSGSFVRRGVAYAIAGTAWVREVVAEPVGARAISGAAVYWLGDVVCLWAGLHSVGEPLPASELLLAYTTGYAAMLLPLPFGGIGGVDAAMTFVLTALGVPLAPALVAVAVYRLFQFWVPTLPALGALVTLPRAGRGLERAADALPAGAAAAS